MIKKRKDSGFTLIELMIVIAVIGILAVVMIPKVGTIKTQSRTAGIDTNIRAVEGFVESRISSWNSSSTTMTASMIASEISTAATDLVNPLDSADDAVVISATTAAPATHTKGIVYVRTYDNATSINIDAYDNSGNKMTDKHVSIAP